MESTAQPIVNFLPTEPSDLGLSFPREPKPEPGPGTGRLQTLLGVVRVCVTRVTLNIQGNGVT